MNIDFHFYATYYAAVLAGLKDEAKQIAWAAQMVDKLGPDLAREKEDIIGDENYIVTVQDTEGFWDSLGTGWESITSDNSFNCDVAQAIRAIWIPFHFLPGHLFDDAAGYENEVKQKAWDKIYDFGIDKDNFKAYNIDYIDACLRLRCGTNSPTVMAMLDHFKGVYDSGGALDRACAVGIAMHVLADTFAHDDFSGAPCYVVNTVRFVSHENAELEEVVGNIYTKSRVTDKGLDSINSAIYIGHTQINHAPDYDFFSYRYLPRYACPKGTLPQLMYGLYSRKPIVNIERFYNAFLSMYNAMMYITGKENKDSYNPQKRPPKFTNKDEDDLKNLFRERPFDEDILTDHEKIVDFKMQCWDEFLKKKLGSEYDSKSTKFGDPRKAGDDEIFTFAKQAKAYRNKIIKHISDRLDDLYKNNTLKKTIEFKEEVMNMGIKGLNSSVF